MFNFFKKQKQPSFRLIRNFHKKNFYFIRNAEWGWLDDKKIFIKDHRNSKVVTPALWAQNIFIAANGRITIEELVHYVADLYKDKVPETLEQTIIFELIKLEESGFVALVHKKQSPQKEFDEPGLNAK